MTISGHFWQVFKSSRPVRAAGGSRMRNVMPKMSAHSRAGRGRLGPAHPVTENSAPAAGARGGGGGPADPGSAKSLSPLLHGSCSRELARAKAPPSLQRKSPMRKHWNSLGFHTNPPPLAANQGGALTILPVSPSISSCFFANSVTFCIHLGAGS